MELVEAADPPLAGSRSSHRRSATSTTPVQTAIRQVHEELARQERHARPGRRESGGARPARRLRADRADREGNIYSIHSPTRRGLPATRTTRARIGGERCPDTTDPRRPEWGLIRGRDGTPVRRWSRDRRPIGRFAGDARRARCSRCRSTRRLPPAALGDVGARPGPSGSGGTPRGAGGDPDPAARAGALRPDGGVAVHLLPRRRPADGCRPVRRPAHGHRGPDVRRRASRQLRPLRVTRARPALRHQRLRRDPARSLRIRPEAPRGKPRRRRPGSRIRRACEPAHRPPRDPLLSGSDGGLRRDACDRRVLRPSGRDRDPRLRRQASPRHDQGDGQVRGASRRPPSAAEADRAHRWRPPDRRAAADADQARGRLAAHR